MFERLESLFHRSGDSAADIPADVLKKVIERTVDATDPRVRILSSYAKLLREPVIHTIRHVAGMIEGLALPLPMTEAEWSRQSLWGALLAGPNRLVQMLEQDPALKAFRQEHVGYVGPVYGLLLAEYREKQVFGADLVNDHVVQDVRQTVISFDAHRLVGLSVNEAESIKQLKWRAFDYVLTRVLSKLFTAQAKRDDLHAHRRLLQAKMTMLSHNNWQARQEWGEQQELLIKLEAIHAELAATGGDGAVFQQHLQLVADALARSEGLLWIADETLWLDHSHVRREANHPKATRLPLQMLIDDKGTRLVLQRVLLA